MGTGDRLVCSTPPRPARIAIPVDADRTPLLTTRAAVLIGRQAGLDLEFVAAAPSARRETRERALRARCDDAVAGGAARASWEVVDGGAAAVGPYITWSGATLRCIGSDGRRHPSSVVATGACAVPLMVVGHRWRPPVAGYRDVVVGLDGESSHGGEIAATAATLAERLGARVTLIGVVAPGPGFADVASFAHLHWIAEGMLRPPTMFDTVAARQPGPALARFLDVSTILVVGGPGDRRWILGGVGGGLARRASSPILVVPAPDERNPDRSSPARALPFGRGRRRRGSG